MARESVHVVIPWRGGCPHRESALQWVLGQYAKHHPDWQVTVAEAPAGPWIKASCVTPAIEASSSDIVIVADADVWSYGLAEAVSQVEDGAAWAVPHTILHRLSEEGTTAVLAGGSWSEQPLAERPYKGIAGGGYVIATRDVLLSIPLDPRFVGWGSEDESWAVGLWTLLGPPWRGDSPLVHLWHPPQQRMTRRRGSRENWELRRRYLKARRDPAAMTALLEEARCLSPS